MDLSALQNFKLSQHLCMRLLHHMENMLLLLELRVLMLLLLRAHCRHIFMHLFKQKLEIVLLSQHQRQQILHLVLPLVQGFNG